MGFFELLAAAMPWETVEAEAPEKPEKDEESEVCKGFCFLVRICDIGDSWENWSLGIGLGAG